MNRDSKREIGGKKSKFYLPEPIISPRRPIVDLLQEEEEEERVEEEEEDDEDLPRMKKRKKRESHLISQK